MTTAIAKKPQTILTIPTISSSTLTAFPQGDTYGGVVTTPVNDNAQGTRNTLSCASCTYACTC